MNLEDKEMWREVARDPLSWVVFGLHLALGIFLMTLFLM